MKMLCRDPKDGSIKYFEVGSPAPLAAGLYKAGYGGGFALAGLKMLTLDLLQAALQTAGETPLGMGARDGFSSAYVKAERTAVKKEISRLGGDASQVETLVPDRWPTVSPLSRVEEAPPATTRILSPA